MPNGIEVPRGNIIEYKDYEPQKSKSKAETNDNSLLNLRNARGFG